MIFEIITIIILVIFASCNKKERLDPKDDYALIQTMESSRNQSDKGIDIEALENSITIYEKRGEKGKTCLCDAFIGCKLFLNGDYDKSLMHLKRAEINLQYCDSMASFVYAYIVKNTMTTDTVIAVNYAKKALEKNLEYNNLKRLPYSYLDLSLLTKGDSAQYYLQKSLNLFDEDKKIMAKAQFGKYHAQEMNADSVIEYVKPYYEKINYVGYAHTLVEAYIRKDMPDSTKQYIQHLASRKDYTNVYFYCNAKIMTLNKEYEEACKLWKIAYESNEEELKFMISQRLSAINAEYDLLNAELENKKEKLMIMRLYNMALLIVIGGLIITFVTIIRYRKNIEWLEKNIVKSKERFNTLLEQYKDGYEFNKNTIFTDVKKNLQSLQEDYQKITNTDLIIIWMTFMNSNKDTICNLLNISSKYYNNRRSIIQKELNIQLDNSKESKKQIDKLVKKYFCNK
jgi:hypothetical protein